MTLRQALDLYACVRPVKSIPGVATRFEDVDLIVVRENTEDLYSGLEHRVAPGVVESIKVVTERACLRIASYAFALAEREGRRDGHRGPQGQHHEALRRPLPRVRAPRRARAPDIDYREMIIDNCAMQLVRDPTQFDVLLLENLYGDILSDLCAGLVGGLGVVPGANVGETLRGLRGGARQRAGHRGQGAREPRRR